MSDYIIWHMIYLPCVYVCVWTYNVYTLLYMYHIIYIYIFLSAFYFAPYVLHMEGNKIWMRAIGNPDHGHDGLYIESNLCFLPTPNSNTFLKHVEFFYLIWYYFYFKDQQKEHSLSRGRTAILAYCPFPICYSILPRHLKSPVDFCLSFMTHTIN